MPQNKRRYPARTATPLLGQAVRGCFFHVFIALACSLHGLATYAAEEETAADKATGYEVVSLQGKVVWFGLALHEQLGIHVVPEAAERVLALQTIDGQLIPLIEDLRTRAFRQDERLRAMTVELKVRRYQATPALQILGVYEVLDGRRYEVDYWCDVCAIPMYETGPCACCQAENRLRKRLVEGE